jgi:hypothetical protein
MREYLTPHIDAAGVCDAKMEFPAYGSLLSSAFIGGSSAARIRF